MPHSAILRRVMALFGVAWLLAAGDAAAEVRLVGASVPVDAPTKIADRLGYFNSGLSPGDPSWIEAVYAPAGRDGLGQLVRGEAAFALMSPTPIAAAALEQKMAGVQSDLVVVASIGRSSQTHQIVAKRGAGIIAPGDLEGRRVGLLVGSSAEFVWTDFARAHGMDPSAWTTVDVRPGDELAALSSGLVDVVATWSPFSDRLARALGDEAVVFPTRDIYSLSWLLVTTRAIADEEPALVDRVLEAYLRAIDLQLRDPARAQRLHAAVTDEDEAELARLDTGNIWRLELGWALVANVEEQLRWLAGDLPPPMLPTSRDYVHAAAMHRVAPHRLALPDHLLQASAPAPVQP
ncbi:MAG: ABC transporter substrate-binding protein [Pseudomonadota bacterium]